MSSVSLIGGFEPVVLSSVIEELEGLSHGKGRDGAAARCGLALGKNVPLLTAGIWNPNRSMHRLLNMQHRLVVWLSRMTGV